MTLTVFRYLLVLKIYSSRNISYRFSVLTVKRILYTINFSRVY